jgi:hypothetical protein
VNEALRIIHSLSGKRLDPKAVFALDAVYQRGEIRIQRQAPPPPIPTPAETPAPLEAAAAVQSSGA